MINKNNCVQSHQQNSKTCVKIQGDKMSITEMKYSFIKIFRLFCSLIYLIQIRTIHSIFSKESGWFMSVQFSSVTQSCPTRCNPMDCSTARLPFPSPTPGACSNSCPPSQWCHPTISSSVIPFSSCLQSFSASRSFPVSPFFTSGDQSIGVSASSSVIPISIQD